MPRNNGRREIDLSSCTDIFDPATTIKREAMQNPEVAKRLVQAGYTPPRHWKRPDIVRPFVAWDGEGITYAGDAQQSYVLFGASTGDSIAKPQLGSRDCFDLLLSVEQRYPDAIHVGFALQYDVNMMLQDLPIRHLFSIYRRNKCRWEGYRIEYRPGKWFTVTKNGVTARLFDVFGFFQTSFVVACEKFLGKNDPELTAIREGKAARASFQYAQLDTFIKPYWEGELRLLVRLMESLREDLATADIHIVSWHGPGAVANKVFRSNNIHSAKKDSPQEVNRAAQYAYAGGRFELFRAGHHPNTVWEYDINSAYPTAIAGLPNLARGSWRETNKFVAGSFGVWLVRHDDRDTARSLFTKPQPLFYRDHHGNVSYPGIVEGWYWTPEAALVADEVVRGWVFEPSDDSKPFAFVREMYAQRREWKRQGNSAEKALKLALNSLYGKMAQRVGYTQETGIPKWHQLEWAGFVTSATRARLWGAMSQAGKDLIAVETDALFTSKPLNLPTGEELGQWEATKFDNITYIQSGMYYAEQDGVMLEKYRGFDKGSLPHATVMQHLQRLSDGVRCACKRADSVSLDCPAHLWGYTTRFIGMGVGLFTKAAWRSWQTEPRQVAFGGGGKRCHVKGGCPQCKRHVPYTEQLHSLSVVTAGGRSFPHSLPWLSEGDPAVRQLEQLTMW